MELFENERIDYVNDNLSLIQKTKGLTFGTDALLLAGYIMGKYKKGLELGGGSGIISMLIAVREKCEHMDVCEIQEEYSDLITRNIELNGLGDKIKAVHCDIRELNANENMDIVVSNPPYMKADSGRSNAHDAKNIARHEIHGDIYDFSAAASHALKYGGSYFAVYRPDRLIDLIDSMRKKALEPKRMTFVHAYTDSEPSMVLIEAKKGGKTGLNLTRPLIIYKSRTDCDYTDDMDFIMENGVFPKDFKR